MLTLVDMYIVVLLFLYWASSLWFMDLPRLSMVIAVDFPETIDIFAFYLLDAYIMTLAYALLNSFFFFIGNCVLALRCLEFVLVSTLWNEEELVGIFLFFVQT